MPPDPKTHFWVFFDTATRAEYYGDVHRVLALPPGALIEYEYREKRLDPLAHDAAKQPIKRMPKRVAVIYAQWTQFERGSDDPPEETSVEEMVWSGLRLGELVACWTGGEHVHFQFQLGGYPRADDAAIVQIIDDLIERKATPYRIWVALSDRMDALAELGAEPIDEAWQGVVDRLASTPMQFVGDAFWRAQPPTRLRRRKGKELRSKYMPRANNTPAKIHRYVVPENAEFGISVDTHEPHDAASRGGNAPTLKVITADDGPIVQPEPSAMQLRRNTTLAISLESKHSAQAQRRNGNVQLRSDDSAGWGSGVELLFEMRLARWKRALGVLLLAIGALTTISGVGGAIASGLGQPKVVAIVVAAVGIVLLGAGQRLYTGKWKFST